ncbi:heparan sulfate 3-O sulfotransferase-A isoform 2-T8 [Glossina fuscipes fuscipes]
MTTAKRRANSGATIVADNHYSQSNQQQQQQQLQQLHQHSINYQEQQRQQPHHGLSQQTYQQQQQPLHTPQPQQQQQQPQIITDHSQQQQYNYQQMPSNQNYRNSGTNETSLLSSSTTSSSSSSPPSTVRNECSVKLPLDILWLPKSAMRPVGPDTSHTDCILVVGVSRPKLAVVFLTVMLISLFLTFHVLYDSAVYNIQAAQAVNNRHHHHHHQNHLYHYQTLQQQKQQQQSSQQQTQTQMSSQQLKYNQQRTSLLSIGTGSNNNRGDGGSASGTVYAAGSLSSAGHVVAFMNSNSINRLSELYDKSADISSNQQISHPMVFPSNRVHFPKTSRRLPQALIIGIRKCGTRALLEMLYLHPRIQKAGGEVHFFDRDENYMKGLDWYRKKMPHSFRGQITIEKSPSYFVSPEVPERVRAMNASIKLLLIVREPVTRAISDYTQLRSHAATASLPVMVETPTLLSSSSSLMSSTSSLYSNGVWTSMQKQQKQQKQEQQQQQQHQQKQQKISGFYNKLSAGNAAAMHDNALADSGAGIGGVGSKLNWKSGNAYRQYKAPAITTTTTTTTLSAANLPSNGIQISSKTFEELAIFPNGTVNDSYRPLTISMYHLHLHRWLEVFPREQLLVVNGDRLIDDPVSQLRRIETFLGIEHRINGNHFYFNETKGFYCLRYDSGDRCLRETKGRKHPHVDPLVISKLRKFFAEHNQRFYELIGEDLGWPEE